MIKFVDRASLAGTIEKSYYQVKEIIKDQKFKLKGRVLNKYPLDRRK